MHNDGRQWAFGTPKQHWWVWSVTMAMWSFLDVSTKFITVRYIQKTAAFPPPAGLSDRLMNGWGQTGLHR